MYAAMVPAEGRARRRVAARHNGRALTHNTRLTLNRLMRCGVQNSRTAGPAEASAGRCLAGRFMAAGSSGVAQGRRALDVSPYSRASKDPVGIVPTSGSGCLRSPGPQVAAEGRVYESVRHCGTHTWLHLAAPRRTSAPVRMCDESRRRLTELLKRYYPTARLAI